MAEDESPIRADIAERVSAVRRKDVDALLAFYADDVVTFDLVAPLANEGVDAVRKRLEEWFSSFESSIDYDIDEVSVAVSGEVAFDRHFTRVRGTNRAGEQIDMWFRETVGYERRDGRWVITHQHSSVPFDMETGKPLLHLQP